MGGVEDPAPESSSTAIVSREPSYVQSLEIEQEAELPKAPRTRLKLYAILLALYLALFIAALDATILATAVPTITADLHSASGYFWIGAAYLLANAAAAPIWAKCSDIWGRKPALLAAVVFFAGSSIMAALSINMRMLLAARALQGTAGGGLIQLVNITISDLFSVRLRTLYLGMVEVMWALAGGLGPVLGGIFTQLVTWRWCFWVNLPVCGVTFVLIFLFLDVHNPKTSLRDGVKAIDWFGTFSILSVTLLLLLGLDFGGATFPWSSANVICLLVFGTTMLGVFVFSEKRLAKYPIVPLSMFRNWSNNAAFVTGFTHGMAFIVSEYYFSLYFQGVKGVRPLRSGVLLLPLTVAEAVIGILTGILIHQTGRYRELCWLGMALLTLGTGLYIHLDRTSSVAEIVGFELVAGIGSGFMFESPLIAIQALVSQADTATATASFGFIRCMAMSTSIVLGGVVFQNSMDGKIPDLRRAGLDNTLLEAFSHGNAAANVNLIKQIPDIGQMHAVQAAFASSLSNMWAVSTGIAGVGLLATLFIKHTDLATEHTETVTGIEKMTQRDDS